MMKLDWKHIRSGVEADLPAIPGYTDEAGEAIVLVQKPIALHPDDYGWNVPGPVYDFILFIPYKGDMLQFSWRHFDVPEIGEWYDEGDYEWEGSEADNMDYVEQCLDPEVIADSLKAYGYPPDNN